VAVPDASRSLDSFVQPAGILTQILYRRLFSDSWWVKQYEMNARGSNTYIVVFCCWVLLGCGVSRANEGSPLDAVPVFHQQ
jgi:hypothetical protein